MGGNGGGQGLNTGAGRGCLGALFSDNFFLCFICIPSGWRLAVRFAKVSLRCRASELQNFSWGCWGLLRLGLLGIWETYTKGAAAVVVRWE